MELMKSGQRSLRSLDTVQALSTFRKAASGAARRKNRQAEAEARNASSEAALVLGKWTLAEQEAEQVLQFPELNGDARARAHYNLGEVMASRGDPEAAWNHYQKALEENPGDLLRGQAICRLAALAGRTGLANQARDLITEILETLNPQNHEERELAASLYNQLGLCHLRHSQLSHAQEAFRAAIDVLKGKPSLEEAHARRYLGVVASLRGRHRSALELHLSAHDLFEKAGCRYGLARTYESIGRTYLVFNRLEEALFCLKRSAAMCEKLGAEAELATIYGKLGHVHFVREEYEKAAGYFRRDLKTATRFKNDYALGFALRNLGRCEAFLGLMEPAIEHLLESLLQFEKVRDALNLGRVQMDLCQAYARAGRLEEARQACLGARSLMAQLGMDREVAYLNLLMGQVARKAGQIRQAEKLLKSCLEQLNSSPAWQAEAYFELGELYRDSKPKSALEAYQNAFRTVRKAGLAREEGRYLAALESFSSHALFSTLMEDVADRA